MENKDKSILEDINKKIIKNPALVWGVCFLALLILSLVFRPMLPSYFVSIFIFVFWAIHPYICYVLAKNKNRSGILWAILGAWFFVLPIIILWRLSESKDGVW